MPLEYTLNSAGRSANFDFFGTLSTAYLGWCDKKEEATVQPSRFPVYYYLSEYSQTYLITFLTSPKVDTRILLQRIS